MEQPGLLAGGFVVERSKLFLVPLISLGRAGGSEGDPGVGSERSLRGQSSGAPGSGDEALMAEGVEKPRSQES